MSLEDLILAREWFYEFVLPSGRVTRSRLDADGVKIHNTRLEMMWRVVEAHFGDRLGIISALDVACHEGFFAYQLATRCRHVLGIDVNAHHLAAASQIREVFGLTNLDLVNQDLNEPSWEALSPRELVLAYGIVYHLENPIGVLRRLRHLTREVLLIETQTTMLEFGGPIDWGSHLGQKEVHGVFGIVAGAEGSPEGPTSNIALVPSRNGLIWVLRHLGFAQRRSRSYGHYAARCGMAAARAIRPPVMVNSPV